MDNFETLKIAGELPQWMDEPGLKTLSNGSVPNETPKMMYRRVSKAAASYYQDSAKWEEKFFNAFWNNWLCAASPILSNLGSDRGLPISCNSIHVADSLDSIFMKNYELAILSKNGAGVGIYFGDIRGRGTVIKGNGVSEGIIPWAKTMDQTTLSVSQGCYDDKTELLTEKGWMKFNQLTNDLKVAQVSKDGILSFTNYTDYIEYEVNENLCHFNNKTNSIDLLVTKNHRMAVEYRKRISNKRNSDGKFLSNEKKSENYLRIIEANNLSLHRDNRFWNVARDVDINNNYKLTPLDQFHIAYQAGGSTKPYGNSNGNRSGTIIYTFHFSKERKINRLHNILNALNWHYTEHHGQDKTTTIMVRVPVNIAISKQLDAVFDITTMNKNFANDFIKEIGQWDSSLDRENITDSSVAYTSTIESNVDFVQAVAFIAGMMSHKREPTRRKDFHKLKHHIYICYGDSVGGEKINKTHKHYRGKVYCVTVPTGLLVVRRNGSIAICGNSTRRGASAIYLPIDHLDIEEFVNIRRPTGDVNRRCLNINHAVCITDKWMEEMLAGDHKKRKTWEHCLTSRVESGEPYMFFTDNVNKNNPECYKANNLTVKTSNICCLSGDTLVLTSEGHQRIEDLVGKTVSIFDGKNWVNNNSFSKRGETELYRVHLANGTFIDCTNNHRWFAARSYANIYNNKYYETETKNLEVGQWLEYHREIISGDIEIKKSNRKSSGWRRIVKIEKLPGTHPVYCPTIPTTGKFALANGLMTGNSEIVLYTDSEHSFVCCLSSLNLVRYNEWKDTDLPNVAVRFLDAVLEEYIQKTEHIKGMEASRLSAIKGRAIGIGVLGWHTLLQEKGLPFDSFDTMQLNAEIFRNIRSKAEEETTVLAQELGEPEWCKGFNRRNTHLLAVAPTVSNSTISGGYSAGIEPISANIFVQKSAKGTFIRKNSTLEKLLEAKGKNTSEIWKSINEYAGSIQHLSFLSPEEKSIFLTAREINQHTLVKLAIQRQKWIDQAQSVNLFFASNSSPRYIHDVHIAAWKGGLKTLYYLRSAGVIKGDMASRDENDCKACEA